MFILKVGSLSTLFLIIFTSSLNWASGYLEESESKSSEESLVPNAYDTYHYIRSSPDQNTGSYPMRKNLPLESQEDNYNKRGDSNRENISERRHIIREYRLRRHPLTGKLYIEKVVKYMRDNGSNGVQYVWKEVPSQEPEKDNYSQVINTNESIKPVMQSSEPNNYRHVKKQLSEKDYHDHLKDVQETNMQHNLPYDIQNRSNKYNHSEFHNVMIYKLFRQSFPYLGKAWIGIMPVHLRSQKEYNRDYLRPAAAFYHKKAALCIVNGNPESCRNALRLAMYLQSMLKNRRIMKYSHVGENMTHMEQKTRANGKIEDDIVNTYLKMLSNLLGTNSNNNTAADTTENSTDNIYSSRQNNVLWNIFNLWKQIFNENLGEIQHEGGNEKDVSEKLINVWADFMKGLFENDSEVHQENSSAPLYTEYNDTVSKEIMTAMRNLGLHIISDLFNKESNGQSNNMKDIQNLWLSIFNSILGNRSTDQSESTGINKYFGGYVRNITEHIMNALAVNGQSLYPSQIRNMMENIYKIWKVLWNQLFPHIVNTQQAQHGNNSSAQGLLKNQVLHMWEVIWNSLLGKNKDTHHNINKTEIPVSVTTENVVTNSQTTEMEDSHLEGKKWEDLIQALSISIDGVNGTFVNINKESPLSTPGERKKEDTMKKKQQKIFKAIADKFEDEDKKEIGTEEDNYWENMMHNILYNENDVRDKESKNDHKDMWSYIKNNILENDATEKSISSTDNGEMKNEDNDVWHYIINQVFGTGSEVDADTLDGHEQAWDYVQQWVENFTNPITGQDLIWKYIKNISKDNSTDQTNNLNTFTGKKSTVNGTFNVTSKPIASDTVNLGKVASSSILNGTVNTTPQSLPNRGEEFRSQP